MSIFFKNKNYTLLIVLYQKVFKLIKNTSRASFQWLCKGYVKLNAVLVFAAY